MPPHLLSPATKANFLDTQRRAALSQKTQKTRMIVSWQCVTCGDEHVTEGAASDCCDDQSELSKTHCPVCGTDCGETRSAADCCLWRDIDKPARNRMADAIEAGTTTWARELGLEGAV